ncbi:MAG TPA: adenosylcobinamide-GDP ribazoletransferase [Candidatus Baltobacteraceae bacterium]|nr:adenosylcobinamide-GDP ribazoletransferase [Candidatus Baltobacteraceae bacterium]
MRFARALLASFSYFSVLPGRTYETVPDKDAIAMLPVVGLVIGTIAGAAAAGVLDLSAFWQGPAVLVAWVLCIALSGAIHIDGFLDCCDGLFAMEKPERRLEIMRDPHHGTYAIVGMAVLSFAWVGAIGLIGPTLWYPALLAFTGAASRAFAAVAARAPVWPALVAIVPMLLFFRRYELWKPAVALAVAAVVALTIGVFAWRRLGGKLNGDCYGAIVVVSEVTLLYALGLLKQFR